MPLNLAENAGPLAVRDPRLEDVFADLQGNILNSHGRESGVYLFLRFRDDRIGDARAALADLANGFLTSAQAQADASAQFKEKGENAGLFAHLAISADGYRALGVPADRIPQGANLRRREQADGYSNVFGDGMKTRQGALQDPGPADWDKTYQDAVHALIILAADRVDTLKAAEKTLEGRFRWSASDPIADLVGYELGAVLRRRVRNDDGEMVAQSIEHFGFMDGISQPVLLLDPQGEDPPVAQKWDPTAPPRLVLVNDPAGDAGKSFGSFLVFRKLEQNVRGFRAAVSDLAAELSCSPELVGAMAVGRFADGTPVVLQKEPGGAARALNDFNYDDDSAGSRCPFHAHIRKTNPRLESAKLGALSRDADDERGHRIARRGMPYGDEGYDPVNPPEKDVGLLFMCYQSDIWEQFEFQQSRWSNNGRFLEAATNPWWQEAPAPGYALGTGVDCLVGQELPESQDPNAGPATPRNWPAAWNQRPTRTQRTIAHYVTTKGGEYFFSPSLTGVRRLATDISVVSAPTSAVQTP